MYEAKGTLLIADANQTPVKQANLFAGPFLIKGKGKLSTAEAS